MKKTFAILLVILSNSALAEYNGWFVAFEIETTRNKTIKGHIYMADSYSEKDSLTSKSYVLGIFDRLDSDGENGSVTFFRNRIDYNYTPIGSTEKAVIYTLLDTQRIFIDSIAKINITEMIDFWYLSGISTSHTLGDTAWMKEAPLLSVMAGGFLCSWEIFVHEQSYQTKRILAELEESQKQFERQLEDLEEIKKYADGEEHRKAEEQISDLEGQMDEATSDILKQFDGQKVVVIAFCSC